MKSVDHNAEREKLIDAAISAGADVGPKAITTQMIDDYAQSTRTYIYRYFVDKDDLIKKSFFSSDRNFFDAIESRMHLLTDEDGELEQRMINFFDSVWEYSIQDLKYCKFYVRFYYSEMFDAECRQRHENNSQKIREKLGELFHLGAKRDIILHHIWLMTLSYIMELALGYDTEKTYKERVYNAIIDCLSIYSK